MYSSFFGTFIMEEKLGKSRKFSSLFLFSFQH
jgi:hypothetical protein